MVMCRNSIVKMLRLALCWPLVVGTAVAADISVTSTFVSAGPTCDATAGAGMGTYSTPDGTARTWINADNYCITQGMRLPTDVELVELYNKYPGNQIATTCGWPTDMEYWSSIEFGTDSGIYWYVDLSDGGKWYGQNPRYVTCVR